MWSLKTGELVRHLDQDIHYHNVQLNRWPELFITWECSEYHTDIWCAQLKWEMLHRTPLRYGLITITEIKDFAWEQLYQPGSQSIVYQYWSIPLHFISQKTSVAMKSRWLSWWWACPTWATTESRWTHSNSPHCTTWHVLQPLISVFVELKSYIKEADLSALKTST